MVTPEQLAQFDYILTGEDPELLADNFAFVEGFNAFHRIGKVDGHLAFETRRYVNLLRNHALEVQSTQ